MEEEEIKKHKEAIDAMTQEDMARLWRFASSGHPYFDNRLPLFDYFNAKFKGFNPKISKKIGWQEGRKNDTEKDKRRSAERD